MRFLPTINPRSGLPDYACPAFDPPDIQDVAQRLRQAQTAWAATAPAQRAAHLEAWAGHLEQARDALHAALSADTGRDALARRELDVCIGMLRRWSTLAPGLLKERPEQASLQIPALRSFSRFRPYPLVGVISPWNFPLLLAMIDAIPALAAGCAVMVKPSEITPRFLEPLCATLARVPALEAVLGLISGDGLSGSALIPEVDMLCFTGSVATGRAVYSRCAEAFIPCFLELGGKDPLIVLAGSELAAATDCALRASVQATGQACQSIERIYVHESLYPSFVALLVEKAKAVQLNAGHLRKGQLGPFIMARQADIVQAQINQAIELGATLHCGGRIETYDGGRYLRPTVLTDVHHGMSLLREETFGPVMPVMSFSHVDEAVRLANDSEFGLSAAVFGPDIDAATEVALRLEAGAISINDAALTAVTQDVEKQSFKASGLGGSRMGEAGLLRFLRKQGYIVQTGRPFPLSSLNESEGPMT